ncbi:hypothetical protein WNY59_02715 [Ahrensia kielensis]|uniref:DUF4393 domain-containing protein n=1 Tax=Ahrensia kielensis TaxID=76980 RepID=A0ABU9T411_9HYPH
MKELLPRPTKNAQKVVDLVGVIASSVPIASSLKELWSIKLKRDFERAQEILIEQISSQGIEVLSDESLEFFVPASYKFFDQVRLGEYEHNLEILAGLITRNIGSSDSLSKKNILRYASALSGLSSYEIDTLSLVSSTASEKKGNTSDTRNISVGAGDLIADREYSLEEKIKRDSALSMLASRGLLRPTMSAVLGGGSMDYLLTDLAIEIVCQAKSKRPSSSER